MHGACGAGCLDAPCGLIIQQSQRCFAARHTQALGAKVNHLQDVYVIIGVVVLMASNVAKYILLRRVITRLKQVDMSQWVVMGSPEPTFFSRFRDYRTWRPLGLEVPISQYSELSMWLDQRVYESLNDFDLTANAKRYKVLSSLQSVICVIGVCVFIYFRFVAH